MNTKRIQELETLITKHNSLYWEDNSPEISDPDYDALVEELKLLDTTNILVTKVNKEFVWGTEVKHDKPMLSLDKVYNNDDLIKWAKKVARSDDELFDVQLKYDGCAGKYSSTKHTETLLTRGDGEVGIDVSDIIPFIDYDVSIYKMGEDSDPNQEIVGEIVITNNNFDYYLKNTTSKKPYKNSRNAIAGILRMKDKSELDKNLIVTFVDHEFYSETVSLSELCSNFDYYKQHFKSVLSDYPSDGIVIKLHDKEYSESLGNTDHHPRGAMAFKFTDTEYPTKLLKVVFQSGKRKFTPVALIEPVDIDGVTVSRVSLHNYKNIIDKDIQLNDTVYVKRAGSVIPYIVTSTPSDDRIKITLDSCPHCDSNVIYEEPDLFCSNTNCVGNLKKLLSEGIKTLGIDELGYPTVEKMVDELNVGKLSDILKLNIIQIQSLTGFAEASSIKLFDNIQKVTDSIPDYHILASLNIKGIGKSLSKDILSLVTISELLQLDVTKLNSFDGIGPERSQELYEGLILHKEELLELLSLCAVVDSKGIKGAGKTMCFSGTFSRKKSELGKYAEQLGYVVKDSVTKELSVLVTAGAETTKVKKAKQLGLTILTEDQFLNS